MRRPPVTPVYSNISTESRTALPRVVREWLGMRPGDTLRYRLADAGVLIDKAPAGVRDPFATFSEWSGEVDEKAYDVL